MKLPGTLTFNSLQGFPTFSQSHKFGHTDLNFKIRINSRSPNPKAKVTNKSGSSCLSLKQKWKEFQGIKNWEGLLDPLDDGLRREILRYGEFVQAAYRCFHFDTSSPDYATCRFPEESSMLAECGLPFYQVTKHLHATSGARLPEWARRAPSWMSKRSSWIGYTAVCNDVDEIARLGRRDVVIAYRGTATCMEWAENLRAMLKCLPESMACGGEDRSMVQSGFLSLYTSDTDVYPSLRDSVLEEVRRIVRVYGDEPLSITITGHSLGAALATLTAYDVTMSFKEAAPLVTVFSFGGPRVGNRSFRCQLDRAGTKVLRIVNSEDPITKVPGFVLEEGGGQGQVASKDWVKRVSGWVQRRVQDTQWVYAEIGEELKLSSRGCPDLSDGGVATCHDLKTYLHLVDSFVSSNCPIRMTAKSVLNRAHQEKQQLSFNG